MAKITKRYCEGRKSPYQLFWIEDGVRHSRLFETEEAWEDFPRLNGICTNALLRHFWELTKIPSRALIKLCNFKNIWEKSTIELKTVTWHPKLATIF